MACMPKSIQRQDHPITISLTGTVRKVGTIVAKHLFLSFLPTILGGVAASAASFQVKINLRRSGCGQPCRRTNRTSIDRQIVDIDVDDLFSKDLVALTCLPGTTWQRHDKKENRLASICKKSTVVSFLCKQLQLR